MLLELGWHRGQIHGERTKKKNKKRYIFLSNSETGRLTKQHSCILHKTALIFTFSFLNVYLHVCTECMYVNVVAWGGTSPLELELQVGMNHSTRVLGTELRSSLREACAPNHCVISSPIHHMFLSWYAASLFAVKLSKNYVLKQTFALYMFITAFIIINKKIYYLL